MDDMRHQEQDSHSNFGRRTDAPTSSEPSLKPRFFSVPVILLTLIAGLLLAITLLLAFGSESDDAARQWEYLIVSPGSINFSFIGSDGRENKFGDISDLLAVVRFSPTATMYLDFLGLLGWELVGMLGNIGGDQQYVLKRPM